MHESDFSRLVAVLLVLLVVIGCAAPEEDPGSREERLRAIVVMGRIQSPDSAAALISVASGPDEPLAIAALFALGQLGFPPGATPPPEASAAVLQRFDAESPAVAAAAVEAAGKLATPGMADRLVSALRHPDAGVRAAAAMALFRLRFVPLWRGEVDEAPALPDAAVAALIEAIADASGEVRRAAVYAFSRHGEPRAVAALAAALGDEDRWTRLFAARGLGRSGELAAVEPLLAALGEPEPAVRTEVVAAIVALDSAGKLPLALSVDDSFHVRSAMAGGLGALESEASLAALQAMLEDRSSTVRAAALGALARRQGDALAPTLARDLEHPLWLTRVAAATSLEFLENEKERLFEIAVVDDDPRVRTAALTSAAAAAFARPAIVRALASEDLAVRGTAVGLLAQREDDEKLALLEQAFDRSSGVAWIEIREAIVDALAEIETAQAVLSAIAANDEAPSVRLKARQALLDRGLTAPAASPVAPEPSPLLNVATPEGTLVVLETDRGTMKIRCFPEQAPVHVANFVRLTRDGYYDGLIWHRVVSNFVIQGGDPRGDGWGGPGYVIRDEINPLRYEQGSVGMPKAGKDTGGGQLFITHLPTPHLDGNYTVFGQVVEGLDVIDRIEVGDAIRRAYVEESQ